MGGYQRTRALESMKIWDHSYAQSTTQGSENFNLDSLHEWKPVDF